MNFLNSNTSRQQMQTMLSDWKLTPATMAYKITNGNWIPAKHLLYISARIAKGIAKGGARIIISAPPRHGKSEHTSVHTPTWVLEKFPQKKIILAGYGADLATGFSRRVRDTFMDPTNAGLLNTRIRRDASRVEAFLTEQGGGMYAVGLGGAITGRGAHVLLIDDYIKEIKEALSQAYRDYIWNWFVTTAFTRLEPGGSCIIIATRWHSDDLIGRILKEFPGEWDYIELPAIAEKNDLLGRHEGEALFPDRYNIQALEENKKVLGSIFFQALYQQKPVDETKKLTDSNWFKHKLVVSQYMRDRMRFVRVWDLAATEDGGDYTAGTLLGYDPQTTEVYIFDIKREQLSSGNVEDLVRRTATEDGPEVKIVIEQEPGSAGKALVNHYKVNVLPEYEVIETFTTKNKLVRAQPFIAGAEAGLVYLVGDGDWIKPFKAEFDSFPGGSNDDQVDTAAAGYNHLTGKKIYSASWGRKKVGSSANSKKLQQTQIKMSLTTSVRRSRTTFGRR